MSTPPERQEVFLYFQVDFSYRRQGKGIIKELKRQDMSSYRCLLVEDMLFFMTAEGLCRGQGDMADVVAAYLKEFSLVILEVTI